jgi:hypothetical protein
MFLVTQYIFCPTSSVKLPSFPNVTQLCCTCVGRCPQFPAADLFSSQPLPQIAPSHRPRLAPAIILKMDSVTLPRTFDDTTPAEMLKPVNRRRASPSRSPILGHGHQQSYNTISSGSAHNDNLTDLPPEDQRETTQAREDENVEETTEQGQPWIGTRIWHSFKRWERDNLELVLENRQSVARDHLGIPRKTL